MINHETSRADKG